MSDAVNSRDFVAEMGERRGGDNLQRSWTEFDVEIGWRSGPDAWFCLDVHPHDVDSNTIINRFFMTVNFVTKTEFITSLIPTVETIDLHPSARHGNQSTHRAAIDPRDEHEDDDDRMVWESYVSSPDIKARSPEVDFNLERESPLKARF